MSKSLKDNDKITVCAACLNASCWHGEFMCEEAMNADIIQKTVKELRKIRDSTVNPNNWENEEHWLKQIYGENLGQ